MGEEERLLKSRLVELGRGLLLASIRCSEDFGVRKEFIPGKEHAVSMTRMMSLMEEHEIYKGKKRARNKTVKIDSILHTTKFIETMEMMSENPSVQSDTMTIDWPSDESGENFKSSGVKNYDCASVCQPYYRKRQGITRM